MSIWAEIKKAINSNLDVPLNELLNNSTYGLSAIKTLIDKYRPWYASYGTGVTLKSTSTAVNLGSYTTTSREGATIFTFIPPATGLYRVDMSVTFVNSAETTSYTAKCGVCLRDNTVLTDGDIYDGNNYTDNGARITGSSIAAGATSTQSLTCKAFMLGGREYTLVVSNTTSSYVTSTLKSASIKYTKTLLPYS